jgi:hypothetical protein
MSNNPSSIPDSSLPVSRERLFDAMVERRSLGLRTYVGWVTLMVLIDRGALELHVRNVNVANARLLLQLTVISLFVLLAGMLIQIEVRNFKGRMEMGQPPEKLLHRITRAWATTWPLAGGAVLVIASCLLFSVLPLTR